MTNIYSDELLYYYKNQPNKKEVEHADFVGREVNSSCGDDITVKIKVLNGKIEDIGYLGSGCAICEGTISIMADDLIGQDVSVLNKLSEKDVFKKIGFDLTTSRQKCALIGFYAIKNSLKK